MRGHLLDTCGPYGASVTAVPTTPDPARLEDVQRLGFSPGEEDVRIVVGDCVYYVRVVGRFQSLRSGGSGGDLPLPDLDCGIVASLVIWAVVVPLYLLLMHVAPPALRRSGRRRVGILCFSRAHRWDDSSARVLHKERATDHDAALARVAALADEVRAGKWPHPNPGR